MRTLVHNVRASIAAIGARDVRHFSGSLGLQFSQAYERDLPNCDQLGAERPPAGWGQTVRLTTLFDRWRFDKSQAIQPGDCTIERTRAEPSTIHSFDLVDHCIAMLGPICKASED
jgi:hypothetical protein